MTGGTTPRRLAPPVPLEPREVLRQALADAVFYRDPPLDCPDCGADGGLCGGCSAGLARASAYLALGRDLGVDVPA
jgi:hypothetical protein